MRNIAEITHTPFGVSFIGLKEYFGVSFDIKAYGLLLGYLWSTNHGFKILCDI